MALAPARPSFPTGGPFPGNQRPGTRPIRLINTTVTSHLHLRPLPVCLSASDFTSITYPPFCFRPRQHCHHSKLLLVNIICYLLPPPQSSLAPKLVEPRAHRCYADCLRFPQATLLYHATSTSLRSTMRTAVALVALCGSISAVLAGTAGTPWTINAGAIPLQQKGMFLRA